MEWISVKDRLPEPIKKPWGCSINILACWGDDINNVGQMEYCIDNVRGKETARFKYQGRVCMFEITHWMPLPEPPKP